MSTERPDKEKTGTSKIGTVQCSECHREVPHSAAISRESADYTLFFCGIDCFERWSRENPQRTIHRRQDPEPSKD